MTSKKCIHKWCEVGRISVGNQNDTSDLPRRRRPALLHWNDTINVVRICEKCFELNFRELGSPWKPFEKTQALELINNRTSDLMLNIVISVLSNDTSIKEWPPNLIVKRDLRTNLHNEEGPSVEWPDHFSKYSWHGVDIPSDWIERKESIKTVDFLSERNTERRKVLYEILGRDRVLRMLNATLIDDKEHPEKYPKLYEASDISVGTFRMVQVKEPTTGDIYSHFVDINCKTAKEAVASLWNLKVRNFHPENLKL